MVIRTRDGQACYGAHVVYIWAGVMEIGVLIDRGICAIKFHLSTDKPMPGEL